MKKTDSKSFRIFKTLAVLSVAWGVFAVALSGSNWPTTLGLWWLSVSNLVALGFFLRQLIDFLSKTKKISVFGVFSWMAVKFVLLGLLIWYATDYADGPQGPLLLGLGTYVVVPLLAGLLWSRNERTP